MHDSGGQGWGAEYGGGFLLAESRDGTGCHRVGESTGACPWVLLPPLKPLGFRCVAQPESLSSWSAPRCSGQIKSPPLSTSQWGSMSTHEVQPPKLWQIHMEFQKETQLPLSTVAVQQLGTLKDRVLEWWPTETLVWGWLPCSPPSHILRSGIPCAWVSPSSCPKCPLLQMQW